MKTEKTWFITGASRGFGLDITKAALAAGDNVVATVRSNPDRLTDTLANHSDLLVVVLDVTDEQQVKAGVHQAIEKFGQVDVLVNNAGYGLLSATEEATDEEVRKQYDTNVFGLLNVTRAILPYMRDKKSGHVINISSLFGYEASVVGFGLYASTKFAVEGITEGLALEVNPHGIHVTALAPGLFSTDFLAGDSFHASANVLPAYDGTVGQIRHAVNQLHGNQPGDPKKLAEVVITLANTENPPVHLPVGKDAVAAFRTKMAKAEQEITTWEALSSSTDHVQVVAS